MLAACRWPHLLPRCRRQGNTPSSPKVIRKASLLFGPSPMTERSLSMRGAPSASPQSPLGASFTYFATSRCSFRRNFVLGLRCPCSHRHTVTSATPRKVELGLCQVQPLSECQDTTSIQGVGFAARFSHRASSCASSSQCLQGGPWLAIIPMCQARTSSVSPWLDLTSLPRHHQLRSLVAPPPNQLLSLTSNTCAIASSC